MKTVKRSEVTHRAMIDHGNERNVTKIVQNGNLREWVGIGWIHIRKATPEDIKLWPTLNPY
jgi:hypothetical protein